MRLLPPTTSRHSRLKTWGRRALTIPLYCSLWALTAIALPLLLALTLSFDAIARRRWETTRCLLFVVLYLTCEVAGIVACFGTWLVAGAVGRSRYLHWNFRLECWWASTLFAGAQRIFSMRLVVEGAEVVTQGPFILFLRHASIGDTLLAAISISAPHGIVLRYVLKRELLWDPCLDIVGNRLANCFVHRGSADSDREIAAVQHLMEDLGPNEGVLIYPEGTRFTEAKRQRILSRLSQHGDESMRRRAESLHHVLPPRLGGTIALLERNRGADAVFCAHVGFEGAGSFRDLLAGTLIGQLICVSFWRIPFGDIPADRPRRVEWMWQQWRRIDEWIGECAKRQALAASHGPTRRAPQPSGHGMRAHEKTN
jgi:1-acyl-sn-glycerol-3-phosphate acyltransferase